MKFKFSTISLKFKRPRVFRKCMKLNKEIKILHKYCELALTFDNSKNSVNHDCN